MVNIGKVLDFKMQKSAENGRKVRSISNSGPKFFYVIKPKIDDFIPKLRPPPPQKKTPLFFLGGEGGSAVKCQLSGGLFNIHV